ncbi:MAG TPA: HEAT repeat domain-containing protein [Flavobacteriales bacterium]|nr:HEAT repeat domain-containing protein [Flavobacteriales bacterium]
MNDLSPLRKQRIEELIEQLPIKVAVPALIQSLQDQDWYVRATAARALRKIGESAKDAVPTLIQLLQDQEAEVRDYVADALEKIGTPEALEALEATKEYKSLLLLQEERSKPFW